MKLTVEFTLNDGTMWKETKLAEAAIKFDDAGILSGVRLVGFSVMKGAAGQVFVVGPSRAFGTESERNYFDYLRHGDKPARRVFGWILDEWKTRYQVGAAADAEER